MPSWWPAVKGIRTEKLPDGTELTWNKDSHGQEMPISHGRRESTRGTKNSCASSQATKWTKKAHSRSAARGTFELSDAPGGGTQLKLTKMASSTPRFFAPSRSGSSDSIHAEGFYCESREASRGCGEMMGAPARSSKQTFPHAKVAMVAEVDPAASFAPVA